MIIALCLTGLGCGKKTEEQVDAQTPAEKIEQSVLVRPNNPIASRREPITGVA